MLAATRSRPLYNRGGFQRIRWKLGGPNRRWEDGDPEAPFDKLTFDEVRAAILAGQGFVTHGPGTERPRIVRSATCRIEGCHVKTIDSVPQIDAENSLDDLDACP